MSGDTVSNRHCSQLKIEMVKIMHVAYDIPVWGLSMTASWIVVGIPFDRIASVLLCALGLGGDQESVDTTLETKTQLTCILNWLRWAGANLAEDCAAWFQNVRIFLLHPPRRYSTILNSLLGKVEHLRDSCQSARKLRGCTNEWGELTVSYR
jgi:hypothetical protein